MTSVPSTSASASATTPADLMSSRPAQRPLSNLETEVKARPRYGGASASALPKALCGTLEKRLDLELRSVKPNIALSQHHSCFQIFPSSQLLCVADSGER